MTEDNVAFRLKGFIDEMGLTNSQFADQCGIPRPSLSQLLSGRNKKISDVIVGQIHSAFPQLSVLWLLFGEGPMLSPTSDEAPASTVPQSLFDEIPNSPSDVSDANKKSILGGLNEAKNYSNLRINSVDKGLDKTADLMNEIEKLKRNPRKVVQITVYYDDSTFETFYPKK